MLTASASSSGNNPMLVLTGESDPILMAGFFPTALKLYEVLLTQNPGHVKLAVMTGSLYVMYANAFIQHNAEQLDISQYEKQNSELMRAKTHYIRGRDYVLTGLEKKYPGFTACITSVNSDLYGPALAQLTKEDVDAAYWAGSGWLGAFSVDPLDPVSMGSMPGAVALLERACALDPDYNEGAIWDVLCAFYAAAPADMGGDPDKAAAAYEQAVRASEGSSISVYVTYAKSICIPHQDSAGFDEAIQKALSIDPEARTETRLASVIAREKALWLKEHKEDFFLEW